MTDDTHIFTLGVLQETDYAILVCDGDEEDAFWLPKSKVETTDTGEVRDFAIPEWLAKDRGLI